jgi:TPR repeat protein
MARYGVEDIEAGVVGNGTDGNVFLHLGMMYATGRSVPMDRVCAHKWFNLAAMKGCGDALRHRKEIASEMTADEVREAQRLAREWLSVH